MNHYVAADGFDESVGSQAELAFTSEDLLQSSLLNWRTGLQKMVNAGGPGPQDYATLLQIMNAIHYARLSGKLPADQLDELRDVAGPAMSLGTLQGRALRKPHGYAGDFQMIDDIYTGACSEESSLRTWDLFYQRQPSVQAVRNRKTFFKLLVRQVCQERDGRRIDVLNVASGPCRDVAEFLDEYPELPVNFVCVDMDERALNYAKNLCAKWGDRVQFVKRNALRLNIKLHFDLVWSAGLFDYFDDAAFVRLARRLLGHVRPDGGSLVLGNFSDDNPTFAYQSWADWHLHHRSRETLLNLGEQCRPVATKVSIDAEPLGINLFLRLDRKD